MPKLIGYNIQEIAKGLQILASNMEKTSEQKNHTSQHWVSWKKATNMLAEIIQYKPDVKCNMCLHANENSNKWSSTLVDNPDELSLDGNKFELWKFFLTNKDFYFHNWMYDVVTTSKNEFKNNGLNEIYELFLHIFHSKTKYVPLEELTRKPLTEVQKQDCLKNMQAFLAEKDNGKAIYFWQEIAKYLQSEQYLCTQKLQKGQNFVQLLLKSLDPKADSDIYAFALHWIVNNDKQLPVNLLDEIYRELLTFLKTLQGNTATANYICAIVKTILERKNTKPGSEETKQILNAITQNDLSDTSAQELKNLVNSKEQPHTDFGNDIIAALTQQSLLTSLSQDYIEVISTEMFKQKDKLLYGPVTLVEGGSLYEENAIRNSISHNHKDPYTNEKAEIEDYVEVSDKILQPLLAELNALKKAAENKSDQSTMESIASQIAEFILNIPLKLYETQQQTESITDIRMLGKYYGFLASIQEIFMIFAGEQDQVKAKQLLTGSLLGKPQDLHQYMYLLMQESMFKPNLIPNFIGYIEKNKSQMKQFFAANYTIKGNKCNLITACMYNMRKASIQVSDIKAYAKLLIIMLESVDPAELLKFKNDKDNSIFHLLIWTIYELVAKNSNGNDLEVEIKTLKTKLKALAQEAKGKMSFGKNTNGETILYPELSSDFRGNPALQNILAIQMEINRLVGDLVNKKHTPNFEQSQKSMVREKIKQKQPAVTPIIQYYDLNDFNNYFMADVAQIKNHLLYSKTDASKLIEAFKSVLLPQNKAKKDLNSIINCFIQCRFTETIDNIVTNSENICTSFLSDKDNSYQYLSNICDKIDAVITNETIDATKLKNLSVLFLKKLINNFVLDNLKSASILPINFLDIAQRLASNLNEDDVNQIMSGEIYNLIDNFAKFNHLKGEEMKRRAIVIKRLLKQKPATIDTVQQHLQQSQNIKIEEQKHLNFDEIRDYLIHNAAQIQNDKHPAGLDQMLKLKYAEQSELINISNVISAFYPQFKIISQTIKSNRDEYELLKTTVAFEENLESLRRAKISGISISDSLIDKSLDMYLELSKTNTGNPTNSDTSDILTEYIKIIQTFPSAEKEKFKVPAIKKCYIENQEMAEVPQPDFTISEYCKHNVDTQKREAAEFLIECLSEQDSIIDWPRFTMLCKQLLLEQSLTAEQTNTINTIITAHAYKPNFAAYNNFIGAIQNLNIKINFISVQYAYPKAFQKAFGDDKGNVKDYVIMRKYLDKSEMQVDFKKEDYVKSVKDNIVLAFNELDELEKVDACKELPNPSITLLAESQQIKYFSKYSQTRILCALLAVLYETTKKYLNSQHNQKDLYKQNVDKCQNMLNMNEKITLFENNNALADEADHFWLCRICKQIMYIPEIDNLNIDEATITSAIVLVKTILNRNNKKSFLAFTQYLFVKKDYYGENFLEAFNKCKNETIKKNMLAILYETANQHECQIEFINEIKKLGVNALTMLQALPAGDLLSQALEDLKEAQRNINFGDQDNQNQDEQNSSYGPDVGDANQRITPKNQNINIQDLQDAHLKLNVNEYMKPYINYCLELKCYDEPTHEKQKLEFQKTAKQEKLNFSSSKSTFAIDDEIIWLLCKLMKQLHADGFNSDRKDFFLELHCIMSNIKFGRSLSKRALMEILKTAKQNPQICELAKYDNGSLIEKIIKAIAKFFVYMYLELIPRRNNRAVIKEIEQKIDPKEIFKNIPTIP